MGRTWAVFAMLALTPVWTQAEGHAAPEACKLVTAADANTLLGGGYEAAANMAAGKAGSSESSSCLYRKGAGGTVAVFVLRTPGGKAKEAVAARQESQRRFGRSVTPVEGVCEAAFLLVLSPQKTNLIAGKGTWQLETEVTVGGKSDGAAAQKLAGVACSRLP